MIYDAQNDYFTLELPDHNQLPHKILNNMIGPLFCKRLGTKFGKQPAEDMRILETAAIETELRLRDFVSSLTGKPVVVVFRERDEEIDFHEFCDLEPPRGWEETENGDWIQSD